MPFIIPPLLLHVITTLVITQGSESDPAPASTHSKNRPSEACLMVWLYQSTASHDKCTVTWINATWCPNTVVTLNVNPLNVIILLPMSNTHLKALTRQQYIKITWKADISHTYEIHSHMNTNTSSSNTSHLVHLSWCPAKILHWRAWTAFFGVLLSCSGSLPGQCTDHGHILPCLPIHESLVRLTTDATKNAQ